MSSGADTSEKLKDGINAGETLDEVYRRKAVIDGLNKPKRKDLAELNEMGIYEYGEASPAYDDRSLIKGFGVGHLMSPKTNKQHPLYEVYEDAVAQSASGKGQERHGHGLSFYEQKWTRLADVHGVGFLSGQAQKKLEEAMEAYKSGNYEVDWFERELLGAINYAAMVLLYIRRKEKR